MSVAQDPAAPGAGPEVATLRIGGQELELPVEQATEGQPAVDVGALLKSGGVTTLDYGYANTAPTRSVAPVIRRASPFDDRRHPDRSAFGGGRRDEILDGA